MSPSRSWFFFCITTCLYGARVGHVLFRIVPEEEPDPRYYQVRCSRKAAQMKVTLLEHTLSYYRGISHTKMSTNDISTLFHGSTHTRDPLRGHISHSRDKACYPDRITRRCSGGVSFVRREEGETSLHAVEDVQRHLLAWSHPLYCPWRLSLATHVARL